jgi:peptide/nickel transport system permease protein
MIADGRGFLTQAWWISTFPGLAILIVGIGFSLLGDSLADLFRIN